MKSLTCKQLGGACDMVLSANTFEEIAALSQAHGKEMFEKRDPAHLKVIQEMMALPPEKQKEWFENKRKEFDALPHDN